MTDRTRGVLLLLLVFVVGGVAGAAVDRAWVFGGLQSFQNDDRDDERIPRPIASLGLTADQEAKLRAIALRWRPRAADVLADVRRKVSSMESDMVAEMLCVLTDAQRARYEETARTWPMDSTVLAQRFALVRGERGGCASVTGAAAH